MPLKIVRRHKGRNWYLRGTVRGVSVDQSTGTDDRDAAEQERIRLESAILDRSINGQSASVTWLEASVAHVDAGGSPRFLKQVNEHFGMTLLSRIDQGAIDHGALAVYPTAKPATLDRQFYAPVSAVLNYAAKRGWWEKRIIARPKKAKGRIRWITPDEAEALIDECAAHLRPLVIFSLYTGARVSEALYLDWNQLDLSRYHVDFLETKNGDPRGVPLHSRVISELANLPHRTGPVFLTNRGIPYSPRPREVRAGGQIKTGFNSACRRAGIEDFHPHDMRHTWATWHYQANRDLVALQTLGGWKSLEMVLRYAHTNVSNHAVGIDALPWGKSGESEVSISKKKGKT